MASRYPILPRISNFSCTSTEYRLTTANTSKGVEEDCQMSVRATATGTQS